MVLKSDGLIAGHQPAMADVMVLKSDGLDSRASACYQDHQIAVALKSDGLDRSRAGGDLEAMRSVSAHTPASPWGVPRAPQHLDPFVLPFECVC